MAPGLDTFTDVGAFDLADPDGEASLERSPAGGNCQRDLADGVGAGVDVN